MKKLLVLLIFVSLLNSCDDGNMEVKSFDFADAKAVKCGEGEDFFIYKITGNEALIISINESAFDKVSGTTSYVLAEDATLIYRLYDGPVTTETICSAVPASNPKVIEEWVSTGGDMSVATNVVKTTDATTGKTTITGFNHTISLTNVTFSIGDGEQRNDVIPFGVYNVSDTPIATFSTELQHCTNNDLYVIAGNQVLTLSLDDATYADLFANVPTTVGAPRTALINTANTLDIKVFGGTVLGTVICGPSSAYPTILERWNAKAGIEGNSGIISVETTTNGTGFDHIVTLKNVVLQNPVNQLDFTYGSSYIFGTYTSSN